VKYTETRAGKPSPAGLTTTKVLEAKMNALPSDEAPGSKPQILFSGLKTNASSKEQWFGSALTVSARVFALTADHALVAAGVVAAIASTSFAGFMIARDNGHPTFGGIEHLMIFAQPLGPREGHKHGVAKDDGDRPMDYNATGSIDQIKVVESRSEVAASNTDASQTGPRGGAVQGYTLRFGQKGAAIVQGPTGSYPAEPGVMLPDAGRILSIENRAGRWFVMATNGFIAESMP
jgi:hypothetical protein